MNNKLIIRLQEIELDALNLLHELNESDHDNKTYIKERLNALTGIMQYVKETQKIIEEEIPGEAD